MSIRGRWLKTSIFWLLITLALAVVIVFLVRAQPDTRQVTISTILSDIKSDLQTGQKDTLQISDTTLTLTRGHATPDKEYAVVNDSFDITRVLHDNNIDYTNTDQLTLQYDTPDAIWNWLGALGGLLPFILFGFFLPIYTSLSLFLLAPAQACSSFLDSR